MRFGCHSANRLSPVVHNDELVCERRHRGAQVVDRSRNRTLRHVSPRIVIPSYNQDACVDAACSNDQFVKLSIVVVIAGQ